MSRIIFINRFYWPDTQATAQLLTDLATALARSGRPVIILTSGGTGSPTRERHAGVEIRRVSSGSREARGVVAKGFGFLRFSVGAAAVLLRVARRGDVIVAMTDPPLLGVAAAAIAGMRSASIVHWIQDIYPEIAAAVSGHRWIMALAPLRNRAWRAAAACVTISRDMAGVVAGAGVPPARIAVIPNWPPAGLDARAIDDPAVAGTRRSLGLPDGFVVAYSGNLGRVHDLWPVIDAAARLQPNPRIQFVFIGNGAMRGALETEAKGRRLANVHFLPAQPREQLGLVLASASAHLVTLRRGCERYVFPSKFYGVVAAGRPVIFVGPTECELAQEVTRERLGVAVPGGEPDRLAETITRLAEDRQRAAAYGAAALDYARRIDFPVALRRWESVLTNVRG